MRKIVYRVQKEPLPDDPGWYETDVWDCPNPDCGLRKMAPEVKECLRCDTPQPEDAVYLGRCWGMKLPPEGSPTLADLPRRPLITSEPRGESLRDIEDITDEFLAALGLPTDEVPDGG
jgi:hypothetical protein